MLRVLHLENWKSFHEPVDFTMIAGKESRHSDTLFRDGKARVLPTAAIYGANAAGKSALLDAAQQLKTLVSKPRARGWRIPYEPHKLYGVGEPTVLGVEIVLNVPDSTSKRDAIVYYEVSYTAEKVVAESLYRLRSVDEEAVFTRDEQGVELYGDLEDNEFVKALALTVQTNRLLLETLANSEQENIGLIAGVIEWFASLNVIRRGTSFVMMSQQIAKDDAFRQQMVSELSTADTGICDVLFTPVEREKVPMPDEMLSHFESQLGDDNEAFLINTFRADASFRLRREKNEKVSYERLVTKHKDGDKQFELPLDQESDGTIRYLNLLPILYRAGQQNNRGVYLIDELEDSLHPKLTEELLRRFLNSTGKDQGRQLIFTTHEVHLLHCDMLRRDEIWLVEKHGHNSELVRLTDFSAEGVRDGMDLQKAYMSGRLGGVPRL